MSVEDSLALKYRPKKLSEVIGQPRVVKAFTNAFKSKTLHHAYILSGNTGCGKTTVARAICEEMGLDYIVVNASLNGNIDTLRNEIQDFSSTVSMVKGI